MVPNLGCRLEFHAQVVSWDKGIRISENETQASVLLEDP